MTQLSCWQMGAFASTFQGTRCGNGKSLPFNRDGARQGTTSSLHTADKENQNRHVQWVCLQSFTIR